MRLGIGIDSPYWSVEPQPRRRPQKFDSEKDNSSLAERTRSSDRRPPTKGQIIRIPPIGGEDFIDEDDEQDTESAPSDDDFDPLRPEGESPQTAPVQQNTVKQEEEVKAEKIPVVEKINTPTEESVSVTSPSEPTKTLKSEKPKSKKRLGGELPGLPKKKLKKAKTLSPTAEGESPVEKKKYRKKKDKLDGEKNEKSEGSALKEEVKERKKKKYPKINEVPGVDLPKEEKTEGTKWKENAQKMKLLIGTDASKKLTAPKVISKPTDKAPSPSFPKVPHSFSPLRPPEITPLPHRVAQMGLSHPIPTLNPHPLPSFPLPSFPHHSIHHSRLLSPGKFEEFLYAVQEKGRFEYQSLELKPPSIPKPRKKRVEKKANGDGTTPASTANGSAVTNSASTATPVPGSGTKETVTFLLFYLLLFFLFYFFLLKCFS